MTAAFSDEAELYNDAPCGHQSLDARGVFLGVNDTTLRWLGYTREQLVGRMKLSDLVRDDGRHIFTSAFSRLGAEGSIDGLELELRRRDGSYLPVLLSASAVYDEDGQLVRCRASAFDITRRRIAEEERDRFFDMALDMLCIAGIDGYFKRVNPAFERTLGHSQRELLDQPFVAFVHPDDRDATVAEVDKLSRGERTIAFDNRYRCKDGSYKWLSWTAQPAPRDGLIFAAARDVTDAYSVKAALESLVAERTVQLTESLAHKETLLKEIHHRVKNNLQVISSLLSMQADGVADAATRALLEQSKRRVRSMALIHERLYASQTLARIDFAEYARALSAFLVRTYSLNGAVSLTVDADTTTELDIDTAVPCGLILNELVSNALEHAFKDGRAGQLLVSVAPRPDGGVRLEVRDTGTGLPPGFDPATSASLGMSLVLSLVRQIKGRLDIDRQGGTGFVITVEEGLVARG